MAVVGAAMLVFCARVAADRFLARLAHTPEIVHPTAPPVIAASLPTDADIRHEREQAEQTRIDQERSLRLKKAQEIAETQAREAAALREGEAQKEEAWQHFYKPPKKCESPPDNATFVACGNLYIHERQRFEAQYVAGQQ